MKASEMTNEELAGCIESARLAPAKYVRKDDLNFHGEAIREAAARLRRQDITIAAQKAKGAAEGYAHGCEETREKPSQVGNAAKMRDVLKETKSVIAKCMEILNRIPSGVPYDGLIDDVADELCDLRESHVNAAISAPPRNCDMYTTLDDARNAFFADYVSDETCSSATAFAIWLYDEAKG